MSDISLIGLGPMGTALAQALMARGYRLTVWNRTSDKADRLVKDGAIKAASAEEAIAGSSVTILCLASHNAVESVLASGANALPGRSVISLGSGTPAQARRINAKISEWNGRFLSGAIMVPPSMVGKPEALFFYSGEKDVFSGHAEILTALGGDSRFLGKDPALALLYNTALLSLYWSTMVGYLHAAALVGTAGVSAETFAPTAGEFLTVPKHIMAYCAAQVDAGSYPGDAGHLAMDARAMKHLIETSAMQGIATTIPVFLHDLAREAIDSGHGEDSFASIIEVLKVPTETRQVWRPRGN